MPDGHLLTFVEMKNSFLLPSWMYFRFLQLWHAVRAQFPAPIILEPHSVERLLIARNMDRTLSSIYLRFTCGGSTGTGRTFQAWQCDILALTDEDCTESLQQYTPLLLKVNLSSSNSSIGYIICHRGYHHVPYHR